MARCNCAGNTCSCLIEAGTGVVVTGNGTAADPYRVSVGGVDIEGRVQVDSTSSITMSRLGSGTVSDPYVISAELSASQVSALNQMVLDAQAAVNEVQIAVSGSEDWSGTVVLPDPDQRGTYLQRRLTGNVSLTVADGLPGIAHSCTLELTQDGTGGRSITIADVETPSGAPISLSTAPGAVDVIRLHWNGSRWAAFLLGGAMSIPPEWAI